MKRLVTLFLFLLLLPLSFSLSDFIKAGVINVNASGMDLLGHLNATGALTTATGNVDIRSGALLIGGTSAISSARVGNFAAGTQVDGQDLCLADGTNCPAPTSGWRNSTAQVWLANNATNVSIGYVNSQPVLFIDATSGKAGIGTAAPTTALHVTGNLNVTGNITAGGTIEIAPGTLVIFTGSTVPNGWLVANGSLIPNATYGRLCAVLGTTYGAGNSTHCALPDLRQRFPIGKTNSGIASALGETGGSIDHTHTGPSHTHDAGSLTQPAHNHTDGTLAQSSHNHTAGTLTQTTHTHGAGTFTQGTHTHTVTFTNTVSGDVSATHTHGISGGPGSATTFGDNVGHTHTYDKSDTPSNAGGNQDITGTSGSGGNDAITGSTGGGGNSAITGSTGGGGNDAITGTSDSGGTGSTGSGNAPFIAIVYLIKT